jgi:hypothetical protein
MKFIKLRPTLHLQNAGLDQQTSASAILQVWFGAGPFTNWLIGIFAFAFSN